MQVLNGKCTCTRGKSYINTSTHLTTQGPLLDDETNEELTRRPEDFPDKVTYKINKFNKWITAMLER